MRLEKFLDQPDQTPAELVERIRRHLPRGTKTSTSTLSRLKRVPGQKQFRTASLTLALAIEKATDGQVRAEDLPLTSETKRLLRHLRDSARPLAPGITDPTPVGDAA